MRRTSAILAVLVSGLTGCSGSEAQVPYDGLVAVAKRPITTAPAAIVQAPAAEPIASEPNVPWSIALLPDMPERPMKRPVKRPGKVTIVEAEPPASAEPNAIARDADVHVALEPEATDDKPAAPKSCNGVVNRRS